MVIVGTTTLAGRQPGPAHLDQAVGVVEEAQGDRHQMVDAVDAHHLHCVAAVRLGQQGVNGHDQRVADGAGGDRHVHRRLVPVPVAAGSVGLTSTVMVGGLVLGAPSWLGGALVATVPTEEITPGVVSLLGKVMVTLSPTATSDCWAASRRCVT